MMIEIEGPEGNATPQVTYAQGMAEVLNGGGVYSSFEEEKVQIYFEGKLLMERDPQDMFDFARALNEAAHVALYGVSLYS